VAKKDPLGVKGADPYPEEHDEIQGYKDSSTIEDSHIEQLKEFRTFTGKTPDTEWLKTKNKVRQEIDPFYDPYPPGEKR